MNATTFIVRKPEHYTTLPLLYSCGPETSLGTSTREIKRNVLSNRTSPDRIIFSPSVMFNNSITDRLTASQFSICVLDLIYIFPAFY